MFEDVDLSRREFIIGGVTVLGVGGAKAAAAQTTQTEFQEAAVLVGPASARPDPDDSFFDNKLTYGYLYRATDDVREYVITEADDSWSVLDSSGFFVDRDGDGLLELPHHDGIDIGEAQFGEYAVSTASDLLAITSTETAQTVTEIGPRGLEIPVTDTITTDTTVSDRLKIIQADSSGGAITITLGAELERDGLPIIVNDVGGSAGLAPINITAESGASINGQQTESIDGNYESATFYYSASRNEWHTALGSGGV